MQEKRRNRRKGEREVKLGAWGEKVRNEKGHGKSGRLIDKQTDMRVERYGESAHLGS